MVWGLGLQFVLGLFVIRTEPGFVAFQWLGDQIQVCTWGPASSERPHDWGKTDVEVPEMVWDQEDEGPIAGMGMGVLARCLHESPAQGVLILSEAGSGVQWIPGW